MIIKCDKCNGTGQLEVEDEKLSLADLLISIGTNLKNGVPIPRLPYLDEHQTPEAFPAVLKSLHEQGA